VVLASLWPQLLAHYDSPLDWYERWVRWIEAYNRKHSPGTRFPHQCEARDLLVFASEEVVRLGIQDSQVASLVRYETLRLDAAALPEPVPVAEATAVNLDSPLKAGDFLGAEFPYDLQELLRDGKKDTAARNGGSYVVTRKTPSATIETIQLGRAARTLLERADGRRTARELITSALADETTADPEKALSRGLDLVRSLTGMGLLLEVSANGAKDGG
jgi:hypothetical protein